MAIETAEIRLRQVLERVEALAGGNLDVRIPISAARDEIDALAFGINILADETQYHLANAKTRAEELANALALLEKAHEDLKHAQDQLVQSAKMAALGEFSAGLAHEINNPLTVIRASFDRIETLAEKNASISSADLRQPLERINSAIDRTTKIIKHVRDFSTPHSAIASVSLNGVVQAALDFVTAQLGFKGIEVRLALSADDPTVTGNQAQLEQVVLNMIANAADAIESRSGGDRGLIEIKSGRDHRCPLLSIADNGIGIDTSILNKIYLPFFTTKDPTRGTGLGLSISHRILSAHGASIECESRRGSGTRFTIRFEAVKARS